MHSQDIEKHGIMFKLGGKGNQKYSWEVQKMKSIRKHKASMKQLTKKLAHYERKNTHDCHSWGLPAGACGVKRMLLYKDGYRY